MYDTLKDAYQLGYTNGSGLASHNVPALGSPICPSVDWVGLGPTVTALNIRDYHVLLSHVSKLTWPPLPMNTKRLIKRSALPRPKAGAIPCTYHARQRTKREEKLCNYRSTNCTQ